MLGANGTIYALGDGATIFQVSIESAADVFFTLTRSLFSSLVRIFKSGRQILGIHCSRFNGSKDKSFYSTCLGKITHQQIPAIFFISFRVRLEAFIDCNTNPPYFPPAFLQPKSLDKASELFDSADKNGDGKLDIGELTTVLQEASLEYSHLAEHAKFLR